MYNDKNDVRCIVEELRKWHREDSRHDLAARAASALLRMELRIATQRTTILKMQEQLDKRPFCEC